MKLKLGQTNVEDNKHDSCREFGGLLILFFISPEKGVMTSLHW